MKRNGPESLAVSLRLQSMPLGGEWIKCRRCGEEWGLPRGMEICPVCQERRATKAALAWRREKRLELLAQYLVPRRLIPAVEELHWPSDPRHPECALASWRGEPWCVTIQGMPGVGKSQLAVEMAYRWACVDLELRSVLWFRGALLAAAAVRGEGILERARGCQLLIVDDFGPGMHSKIAWVAVGEVLAQRYDNQAATIITTNLDQKGLETGHDATSDRLLEGLMCRLQGRSRRGRRDRRVR